MSAGVLRFRAALRRSDRFRRSQTAATRRLRPPLGCCGLESFFDKPIRLQRLLVDFVEARDAIVPFEESGGFAYQADGVRIHLPNWIEHRMIVSIEDVFLEFRVAGDMNLADAMVRHIIEVFVGIEIVVPGRDVDVVYVEKNSAIGQLGYLRQKFPFRHLGRVEFRVTAYVFNTDRNFEKIACLPNIRCC